MKLEFRNLVYWLAVTGLVGSLCSIQVIKAVTKPYVGAISPGIVSARYGSVAVDTEVSKVWGTVDIGIGEFSKNASIERIIGEGAQPIVVNRVIRETRIVSWLSQFKTTLRRYIGSVEMPLIDVLAPRVQMILLSRKPMPRGEHRRRRERHKNQLLRQTCG